MEVMKQYKPTFTGGPRIVLLDVDGDHRCDSWMVAGLYLVDEEKKHRMMQFIEYTMIQNMNIAQIQKLWTLRMM